MMNDFNKFALSQGISSLTLHDYKTTVAPQQPVILETGKLNMTAVDIFSRLMADRIIYLGREIDDETANIITAQLLYLNNTSDPGVPIQMYINSPGGLVTAGLGIYDTMQYVNNPICTVCTGLAASMASILLTAGTTGARMATPHARIMIHQPMGGAYGQASDVVIAAKEIEFYKKELCKILSEHSGQALNKVLKDVDRDYWMTPDDAMKYGLIDDIVKNQKKINL